MIQRLVLSMLPTKLIYLFFGLLSQEGLSKNSLPVECKVVGKRELIENIEYTATKLKDSMFSIKIGEKNNTIILSRCSFAKSAGKVTCDDYVADKVETDSNVGITKYYYFKGQFDVQIFPDRTFIENNGRGGVAYGSCK